MKTKKDQIEVVIPKLNGSGEAERIPVEVELVWDDELEEWLLTPEAHEKLEATKARYLGLLLPDEIRNLRKRLGLTQSQICELLQIGEKTWTRWETGRERPSRALNVLLCALRDGQLTVPYLRRLAELRQSRAEVLAQKTAQRPFPWRNAAVKVWGRCRAEPEHLTDLEEILRCFFAPAQIHQLPLLQEPPRRVESWPTAWQFHPAFPGTRTISSEEVEPTLATAASAGWPSNVEAQPDASGSLENTLAA